MSLALMNQTISEDEISPFTPFQPSERLERERKQELTRRGPTAWIIRFARAVAAPIYNIVPMSLSSGRLSVVSLGLYLYISRGPRENERAIALLFAFPLSLDDFHLLPSALRLRYLLMQPRSKTLCFKYQNVAS